MRSKFIAMIFAAGAGIASVSGAAAAPVINRAVIGYSIEDSQLLQQVQHRRDESFERERREHRREESLEWDRRVHRREESWERWHREHRREESWEREHHRREESWERRR
jgi:hypothetical protein